VRANKSSRIIGSALISSRSSLEYSHSRFFTYELTHNRSFSSTSVLGRQVHSNITQGTKCALLLGEEDSVAFIDLPPNNLSKLPEKGILKKSGPYGSLLDGKEKWSEDSQSDNQEILSQSDNNLGEVRILLFSVLQYSLTRV